MVSSLNSTSVNVSWDVLIILDFPIDKYTVIYSQLSQQQNGREMSAEFLPPATSGVINDLRTTDIHQFQVIATVTVDGSPLEGERSAPVNFTRPGKCIYRELTTRYDTKYCAGVAESCNCGLTVGVAVGVIGVLVGILVGVSGVIAGFVIVRKQK